MTLEDIQTLAQKTKREPGINRVLELCFIGLLSYFEAFCKDHYASIINIVPQLLIRLREKHVDTNIDVVRAYMFGETVSYRFGFLVAEKLDFGTPKKINANYSSLLEITPFSAKESDRLDLLISDRNLIVHHGGVITSRYAEQILRQKQFNRQAFWNSITISKTRLFAELDFISTISHKLLRSSHTTLLEYAKEEKIRVTREKKRAIDGFLWWDNERG